MPTTLRLIAHTAMPASDDVRIIRVPDGLVTEMWGRVAPLLDRGCGALPNVDLEDIAAGVEAGTDEVWTVFLNHELVASFVTAQFEDQRPYLGVYALGGRHMRDWVRQMDSVLAWEAKRRGLARVRFAGRKAWARVIPNVSPVGTMGGHTIYERVIA